MVSPCGVRSILSLIPLVEVVAAMRHVATSPPGERRCRSHFHILSSESYSQILLSNSPP